MRHDDPRRAMLVALLVRGERPGAIAAHFGVTGETVRTWRNDLGVQADVETGRAEIVSEALGKLKALASRIPDALAAALNEALGLGEDGKRAPGRDVDPFAVVKVAEAIADRVGLPKTTKLEQKIEVTPSSPEEMVAQLAALAKAGAQGEQEPQ